MTAVGVLVLFTSVTAARADTVLGATFLPDHATPGAKILVAELPLPQDCPRFNVYLSRDATLTPPITSARDPRLIRPTGSVSYRTGHGPNSLGPTPKTTTFAFRVPALTPGAYGTYAQCVGSAGEVFRYGNGLSSWP